MKKRLFALLMACSMTLGMAVTAFATENPDDGAVTGGDDGYNANVKVEGSLEEPTINVTVPTTGAIIINPYGLETSEGTDAIISAAQYIENGSDVAVSVTATVTGAFGEGSTAKFATAALKDTDTSKSIYLYFEMALATDGSTEPTWATAYDKTKHILVAAKATTLKNFLEIPAAGFAAFHLTGDIVTSPATPWAEVDAVDVTIAFTFTPVPNSPAADAGDNG